jgi:L-fuconolactonase
METFIDCHLHLWDLQRVEYAWLKGNTSILGRTYSLAEIEPQLAPAGVGGAVLVQAANNFGDTDLMLENAARHPWVRGVVGWVNLLSPAQTATALDCYQHHEVFKGVRHLIHDEPDPFWLLQPAVQESLAILAERGLTYDVVGTKPEHLRCVLATGAALPRLKLVLDHLATPPIPTGQLGEWGPLLAEAAQLPNVYVKISGLGTIAARAPWTADDLKPYVAHALQCFGPDRALCGGDWPVSLLAGTYAHTWAQYAQVLADLLPPADQAKVRAHNAERVYGL